MPALRRLRAAAQIGLLAAASFWAIAAVTVSLHVGRLEGDGEYVLGRRPLVIASGTADGQARRFHLAPVGYGLLLVLAVGPGLVVAHRARSEDR
ncbi:MAG: hypothetical protein AB7L84_17120 [Acidimicrobiia bacterium]